MFVEITNIDIGAIAIDYYIKNYRNQTNAIPPEFALSVLEKTNHIGHLKTILNYINKLSEEEQLKYKDFVLSAIEGRKQGRTVKASLENLAIKGGYKKEFDEADKKEKFYEPTDCCGTYVRNVDDLEKALSKRAKNIIARIDCEQKILNLSSVYLDMLKELKIYNEHSLILPETYLPEFLDLSQCETFIDLEKRQLSNCKRIKLPSVCDLSNIKEFPDDMDVSQCTEIRMFQSNLEKIDFSKMKKLSRIHLDSSYNLPEYMDFSNCWNVSLDNCNLEKVKEIKFSEQTKQVSFCYAENIPENLDISMCDIVRLGGTDLTKIKHLKFKKDSRIYFNHSHNKTIFPHDLDVSMCSYVNFEFCDMRSLQYLKFRDGAEVVLGKNLPPNLDVSNCSFVQIQAQHMDKIETTKFKKDSKVKFKGLFPVLDILDLSHLSSVDLESCNFEQVKKIRFKQGSTVNLKRADIRKCNIDFSPCAKVNLYGVFLHENPLSFAQDAEVDMGLCQAFPEKLDLSMCKKVNLNGASLHGVKQVILKNSKQKDEFFEGCCFFSGKFIYTEEPQQTIANSSALNR
ncbi:MAG: pentapeptide repeat-containing protein [Alphaproteobacteria bacterium]|nr:pentapeptide repeat-containing protein [Alphaproteobacteria bacterium]